MFAIDCLKSNGTHLGTCIDRFYFGSCCQIKVSPSLPSVSYCNIKEKRTNLFQDLNFYSTLTTKITLFPGRIGDYRT